MSEGRPHRYRRDFFSNPAFEEMQQSFAELLKKEIYALRACGRQGTEEDFRRQNGVVDGVEKSIQLIENLRTEAYVPEIDNAVT